MGNNTSSEEGTPTKVYGAENDVLRWRTSEAPRWPTEPTRKQVSAPWVNDAQDPWGAWSANDTSNSVLAL